MGRITFRRLVYKIPRLVFRNSYCLDGSKFPPKRVSIESWSTRNNLGDYLTEIVVNYLLEKFELDDTFEKNHKIHLMAIGSILGMNYFDATVWGSGIHTMEYYKAILKRKKYVKYDIRAVRGPITRYLLLSAGYVVPEEYGDPAVLMPLIYKPLVEKKEYKISIIEHLEHKLPDTIGIHRIDITDLNYKRTIDEIVRSELVISSSLHGIILAEAYGIQAVFLNFGMDEQLMKFFDWYFSTNRYNVVIAKTLEEAMSIKPMELPDLKDMQNRLINVFPKDIWKV